MAMLDHSVVWILVLTLLAATEEPGIGVLGFTHVQAPLPHHCLRGNSVCGARVPTRLQTSSMRMQEAEASSERPTELQGKRNESAEQKSQFPFWAIPLALVWWVWDLKRSERAERGKGEDYLDNNLEYEDWGVDGLKIEEGFREGFRDGFKEGGKGPDGSRDVGFL